MDLTYVDKKLSSTPFPLIQWSQKEFISIWDRFQSVPLNTNIWISSKGISLKPFSSSSDDDTTRPIGKGLEIITKSKQDPTTLAKAPKLKFTIATKKGKDQGEPLASNVHETHESEVLDE